MTGQYTHLRTLFVLFCSLTAVVARADQAAYITQAAADKAAALIPKGAEVRHFCEPCGDTEYTADIASEVKVQYTGTESFYEVLINGAGADLAYLYLNIDGTWTNVAKHLGLEVSDVSQTLPENTGGTEGTGEEDAATSGFQDFNQMHFTGTLGERKVQMNLWQGGGTAEGTYAYLHVGVPIRLEGTVDAEGQFTLTEYIEEDKTGSFNGTLSKDLNAFTGKWISADASRTLDFSLNRAAVITYEDASTGSLFIASNTHLEYPVFLKSVKGFEDLNKAIAGEIQSIHREQYNSVIAEIAEGLEVGGEESPMLSYELNVGDYAFALLSDSFVSLYFVQYEFSGGAHGMASTRCINLMRKPDGAVRPAALKDLFKDLSGAAPVISDFLIKELKAQEAAWVLDGQTTAFKADELPEFSISAHGLTFYFAPYAVGPYAQGPFEVTVPLKLIASYLNLEVLPAELRPKS